MRHVGERIYRQELIYETFHHRICTSAGGHSVHAQAKRLPLRAMLLHSVRLLEVTEDWEQVPCKPCKGEGWILRPPNYDDGPRCHKCGGLGTRTITKETPFMDIIKEFASDMLQYWPVIASVIVGGLTSITTKSWAPFLAAVGSALTGTIGAKPVASFRARLAKKAS